MTDYNVILDTELDPDAPLKSDLAYRWRDNPIAIVEGSVGAPRIYGGAAARSGNGLAVLTVTAADTVKADHGMGGVAGTTVTGSTSLVVAYTYTVGVYTGTMRFKATHQISNAAGSSQLRIRKNGATVDTWDTSSTSSVARSKDVAIVPGDVIEWLHKADSAPYISTVVITGVFASDAYIEQPLYIKASEA